MRNCREIELIITSPRAEEFLHNNPGQAELLRPRRGKQGHPRLGGGLPRKGDGGSGPRSQDADTMSAGMFGQHNLYIGGQKVGSRLREPSRIGAGDDIT